MRFLKHFGALVTSLMVLTSAFAKPIDSEKLQYFADQYLKQYRTQEYISGVAISVQYPVSKEIISAYSGTVGFGNDAGITPKSLFQIGSITKSFTTAIILQLGKDPQYKFSIEDRLEKYFPEYPQWRDVTVRQLMNMTSGIPSYTESMELGRVLIAAPYVERKPQELLSYVTDLPVLFAPGAKYHYSNSNYLLLGMLIERLTGHALIDEMNARIIKPLHLQHTHYVQHNPDEDAKRLLVHLYSNNVGGIIPYGTDVKKFTLSWAGAAGSAISTSEDVVTWAHALFTPGKVLNAEQSKKLNETVSMKTGKPLVVPTKEDPRGFGMGIAKIYVARTGEVAYMYEGGTIGGRAIYVYVPERNILISATVNSNGDNTNDHIYDLVIDVYQYLIS